MIGNLVVFLIAFKAAGFPIELTWTWLVVAACVCWVIRSVVFIGSTGFLAIFTGKG